MERTMRFSNVCTLFPVMPDAELDALARDIAENGLRNPIVTFRGEIIDGRNRYLACERVGVTPATVEWHGGGSLVAYVLSLNLHRRQMTASQRAMVAAESLPLFEEEAAKRRAATVGRPAKSSALMRSISEGEDEGDDYTEPEPAPEPKRKAAHDAATATGVSSRYVEEAKVLKARSPQLAEQVKSGEITITQAKREVKKVEHAEKVKAVAADKTPRKTGGPYDIILADPPWQYDHQEAENRAIENHYPTADLSTICAHRAESKGDAILFLWATAPKLQEAMAVMKAWGFTYKTCAVWDKEVIGMGYWFRGQHELLMVGVKGNPGATPEPARCASIFREKRGRHSKKPDCVYRWIEQAFPGKSKLEMYCREPREGWDAWGNEV